jgi:ribose transport system substrate-binding protein
MNTNYPVRHRLRRGFALAAATTLVATLAACGSGGGSDNSNAGSSPSHHSNSQLKQDVDAFMKPRKKFPVPKHAVKNVSSISGHTIYYVPITQRAPQFATTRVGIKAAAKKVGAKVHVCDGGGTPTGVSSCVKQATKAHAAGIALDGLPYGMAADAIDAAQKAGIHVVLSNQPPEDKYPANKHFAYVGTAGAPQMIALGEWIALQADGKANILFNQSTDGPGQVSYVKAARKKLKTVCPDCTVNVYQISSASFDKIHSATSSALLKNPNTQYIVSEFAEYLQPTKQGVQQASTSGKVKLTTGASALSTLKQLKKDNSLVAASAQAAGYQGWIDLDALLRLRAGQDVPKYKVPVRLFTKDTIDDVDLTSKAETTSAWFGPTSYSDQFEKLWGSQ